MYGTDQYSTDLYFSCTQGSGEDIYLKLQFKMAAKISQTSNEAKKVARWIRQEYKSNKDKFEKPFKICLENNTLPNIKTDVICLEQSYSGLGTTVWDGSIVLAKIFENNLRFPRTYLEKCHVLELGAGCGLVGITLSILGAKSVVLSDLELCLPTLQRNIDRNISDTKERIRVVPYVWGQDTSSLTVNGKFDILVAAEVLYDEEDSKLLAESALELLNETLGIMFVSMGRNRKGETAFVKTMVDYGYSVNEVPRSQLHPRYQDEIIKVIEVAKK